MVDGNSRTGCVPHWCDDRDATAIIHGCRVPLVLARKEFNGTFSMLGNCILDGAMNGEAVTLEEHDGDEILLV